MSLSFSSVLKPGQIERACRHPALKHKKLTLGAQPLVECRNQVYAGMGIACTGTLALAVSEVAFPSLILVALAFAYRLCGNHPVNRRIVAQHLIVAGLAVLLFYRITAVAVIFGGLAYSYRSYMSLCSHIPNFNHVRSQPNLYYKYNNNAKTAQKYPVLIGNKEEDKWDEILKRR